MGHEQAAREIRAESRANGGDAVRVRHGIDAVVRRRADGKRADIRMWRCAAVDVVRADPLTGHDDEPLARGGPNNECYSLDVAVELTRGHLVLNSGHCYRLSSGTGLGVEPPQRVGLFADEHPPVLLIGHAALDLTTATANETAHESCLQNTILRYRQFVLQVLSRLGVDEEVLLPGGG